MSVTAIQGVCQNGKIEPLEKIPYETGKRVIIIFLDEKEDKVWEDAAATDFFQGYTEKDSAYDKL